MRKQKAPALEEAPPLRRVAIRAARSMDRRFLNLGLVKW